MFIRSEFCTPWCGKSMFDDWLHTPLCERRYAEAVARDEQADGISPFERRRRAGQLPVADITGHRAPVV